jgi:hypothetical protein
MSFEAYLEQYPDGSFVALTNARKCATQAGEQTGALVERIKKLESELSLRGEVGASTDFEESQSWQLCPESGLTRPYVLPVK